MRSFLQRVGLFVSTVGELIQAFWGGPYWWLVPMIVTLLPLTILLVLLQAFPAAAPFVYTLF